MQERRQELYQSGGINGAALKWLAIITMFIDHFAAVLLTNQTVLYTTMRLIGRLAFPIFAFLVIQGYQHTSDIRKYLARMFVFALLSEMPFDLAFYGAFYYRNHQNIFFTLTIGILTLAGFEKLNEETHPFIKMTPLLMGGLLAEFLQVDYGFYGVALIVGLGVLRANKPMQTVFGVIAGFIQNPAASLAFVPLWFYNGERGRQNKWFFYLFYPAHLMLFYFMRIILRKGI